MNYNGFVDNIQQILKSTDKTLSGVLKPTEHLSQILIAFPNGHPAIQ